MPASNTVDSPAEPVLTTAMSVRVSDEVTILVPAL
jgi:hypothetical protein